jgi:hypothetical protein
MSFVMRRSLPALACMLGLMLAIGLAAAGRYRTG